MKLPPGARANTGPTPAPDWEALAVRLRRYSLALTRDTHEADDLAQQTLAKVLALGDRIADPEAYAITAATRLWMTRQRFLRRSVQRLTRLASGPARSAGPAPVDRDEERRRLDRAIQGLPPAQRAVFVLKVVEELDYAAIAAAMECDVGAVRANLHLARTKLRESLGAGERS